MYDPYVDPFCVDSGCNNVDKEPMYMITTCFSDQCSWSDGYSLTWYSGGAGAYSSTRNYNVGYYCETDSSQGQTPSSYDAMQSSWGDGYCD